MRPTAPWQLKAAIQGALSLLPDPQRWNRVLQERITHSTLLDDGAFVEKWQQARRHVGHAVQRGGIAGATVLEFGTGWWPIASITMALAGAARVYTIDLVDLLHPEKVLGVLERFHRLSAAGRIQLSDAASARLEAVYGQAGELAPREILAALGVNSLVGDARAVDLPAGSIDLFTSNNVFEHVPRGVLADILREGRRLAAPGAIASHYIDLRDHYAYFDRRITVYNFLRFSERRWRWFNNSLQQQNRLRIDDYRAMFRAAGWDIVAEKVRREPAEVLRRVPLAPEFRDRDEADLLVCASWLVSRVGR